MNTEYREKRKKIQCTTEWHYSVSPAQAQCHVHVIYLWSQHITVPYNGDLIGVCGCSLDVVGDV